MLRFTLVSLFFWRLGLNSIAWFASNTIYQKKDFVGRSIWANFDGSHYFSISQQGYLQYQQAFFPLFPALMHVVGPLLNWNYIYAGLLIVHAAFFIGLITFWKLIVLDFPSHVAVWAVVFLLLFPTSFFFASIYTESLFFALVLGSFYAARKGKFRVASTLGGLATATRFSGIALLPALVFEWWEQNKRSLRPPTGGLKNFKFQISNFKLTNGFFWLLLIPFGLIVYMFYLKVTVGDPLAFIHVQPAFGANRSGGDIVLLPQVLFRYIKIFWTVPWVEYDARIATLEVFMLIFVLGLLVLSWKTIRKSYLVFSLIAILIPTLTGTLSSMPRYVLAAFPLFIILALIKKRSLKVLLLMSFSLLLVILTMLFVQGYFVA